MGKLTSRVLEGYNIKIGAPSKKCPPHPRPNMDDKQYKISIQAYVSLHGEWVKDLFEKEGQVTIPRPLVLPEIPKVRRTRQ